MVKLFCIMKENVETPLSAQEQRWIDSMAIKYDAIAIVDNRTDKETISAAMNHLDFGTNVILPVTKIQHQQILQDLEVLEIDCETVKMSFDLIKGETNAKLRKKPKQ